MRLVEFVPPAPHPLWRLCPQMGITDVVVKVNPELTGLADPWRFETLSSIVSRLAEAGLRVVGLEGDPFDMSPIKEHGAEEDVLQTSREEALAHYRELLESMGRLGIKLLCYNFMVGKGWSRTGVREGRGGAKATCFSLKDAEEEWNPDFGRKTSSAEVRSLKSEVLLLTHEQVWANYECFVKAVMPTAEKCGVRMALHPDDREADDPVARGRDLFHLHLAGGTDEEDLRVRVQFLQLVRDRDGREDVSARAAAADDGA